MTLPLPLEPLRCRQPDCTLAIGGRCARADEFTDPLASCPDLARAAGDVAPLSPKPIEASKPVAPIEVQDAAPWKGRHLSLEEAEALVRRSPARLISVIGPYDAGKTSLMASFFLQIANGQYGTLPYRFASSRTLYGFQDLVERANRWSGRQEEQIVEHTPEEDSRGAGRFLHIGLRPRAEKDDRHIDLLLSDVPGEWIAEWGERVDEEAKRRLGFISRSDGFIVVADAAALLGRAGTKMDGTIELLIRRVVSKMGTRRSQRGFALVFSKFDRVLDQVVPPFAGANLERETWGVLGRKCPRIWSALKKASEAKLDVALFAVSAFPKPLAEGQSVGVIAPFTHVMALADRRERWPRRIVPVPEGASYFQAMRRWEEMP